MCLSKNNIVLYTRPKSALQSLCVSEADYLHVSHTFTDVLLTWCVLILMARCFSGSPKGIEFNSVKEVLLSVKAVKSMHCLHLWALTLGQALVSVHLAVGKVTH